MTYGVTDASIDDIILTESFASRSAPFSISSLAASKRPLEHGPLLLIMKIIYMTPTMK